MAAGLGAQIPIFLPSIRLTTSDGELSASWIMIEGWGRTTRPGGGGRRGWRDRSPRGRLECDCCTSCYEESKGSVTRHSPFLLISSNIPHASFKLCLHW